LEATFKKVIFMQCCVYGSCIEILRAFRVAPIYSVTR